MKPQSNFNVLAFLRWFVKASVAFIVVGSLAGLAGWIFNIPLFRSVFSNSSPIKFNTTVCLLCAGIALWLLQDTKGGLFKARVGRFLAGFILVIGALTLSEYFFHWNLGMDQLVFQDPTTFPNSVPGRMSPVTALCLMLAGPALLLLGSKISQYFSLAILSLALVAVTGYLFDYEALYQLTGYSSIAFLTAIMLFILALGILAVRPNIGVMKLISSNVAAGRTVRFLLPATVLIILVLGFAVERGEQQGLIQTGHASVVLVAILTLIFSPLIYFYANRINNSELEIIRLGRLYATLSQINQMIVRVRERKELFQSICNIAIEFGGFSLAWIGLLDDGSGEIQPAVANGLDVENWPFLINIYTDKLPNGLAATALQSGRVVTSEDIQTDERTQRFRAQIDSYGYHSSAAVPFRLGGKTIGVLGLAAAETGLFKEAAETRLLEEMGLDISFALDAMNVEAERQKAEKQLLFYSSMVASANDAILSKTLDGIILTWNPGAESLYGYAASEVIGKPLTILLPPERSNDVASILERIKLGQQVEHYETIRLTKDGRRVDVSLTVSPIFNDEGQIIGASSIARDITGRKQTEQQLQRQNKRLKVLREIDTAILAADSLENIVSAALTHTLELVGCRRAVMALIDRGTDEVVVFDVRTSDNTSVPKGTRIPLLSYQDRFKNLSANQPVLIHDLDALPDLPPLLHALRQEGLRSACILPLFAQGDLIGAFNLSSEAPNYFDEEKIGLGREVANQVAIALTQMYLIEDLRESEEKYRAFFENSLDAILLAAADGSIQAANPAACKMLGRTEAEICSLSRDQLVDQSDPRLKLMLEERTTTGKTLGELTMFRKDGSPFPVELSSALFKDRHGNTLMSMLIRDITERKRTEEKIQRHLKHLNALRLIDIAISSSFDLHVILDVVLQQALAQLEVDASALLLFDTQQQTLEYASSRGFRSEALRRTTLRLGEGYASQAILTRKTIHVTGLMEREGKLARSLQHAQEEFMDYYGTPLIVKGEVKGVLEIYHRSPLKADAEWLEFLDTLAGQAAIAIDNAQLFESLEQSNATLERRVVERTMELNQINSELEHANRAKDEFLATMSHELRTPLTSILGLSETLLEQKRDPLTAYQQRSVEIIGSSGQHLLELINDILDLSKIEAGKFDFYPQSIVVDDICRSSLSFIRAQAIKKSITITYKNESAVAKIYADPRRLKQILVNLLINAVKFTPKLGEVILQVQSDRERDLIQFSVIDNGMGIASTDLGRLFQPFVQLDSSLNRQYEGTGLGLALAQKLTDQHGGSIEVESEVGKGSRFMVNLPCKQEETANREQLYSQPAPLFDAHGIPTEITTGSLASRQLILLADDNMPNILTIGEYLEAHGYEVVTAHDGLEAIERAEALHPDLILMDIQMPSMNGLEAVSRLKANLQFENTPIIMLTALAMPGDRERSLLAGANEYMSKPVSLGMLREKIADFLQGRAKPN